jgi:hypothetical protein
MSMHGVHRHGMQPRPRMCSWVATPGMRVFSISADEGAA